VDLPLEHPYDILEGLEAFASFNPCFSGSASRTHQHPYLTGRLSKVSILVLVDLPLEPGI